MGSASHSTVDETLGGAADNILLYNSDSTRNARRDRLTKFIETAALLLGCLVTHVG